MMELEKVFLWIGGVAVIIVLLFLERSHRARIKRRREVPMGMVAIVVVVVSALGGGAIGIGLGFMPAFVFRNSELSLLAALTVPPGAVLGLWGGASLGKRLLATRGN